MSFRPLSLLGEFQPAHGHRASCDEPMHVNADAGTNLHPVWPTGGSGSEDLVEQHFGLVLGNPFRESQLGDQNLARLGQHPLLAGGESTLALTPPQVAYDFSNLHHIAGVQLLQVGLVSPRPVGRFLRVRSPQHAEDPLQAVSIDDIADAHEVEVAGGYPDHQVALTDDPKYEIELVFTLDLTGFDVLDHGGPMIGVDHRFADCKGHIVVSPFRTYEFSMRLRLPQTRLG